MGIIKLFKMIDHISYGINYVKANPYEKRSKLIFILLNLKDFGRRQFLHLEKINRHNYAYTYINICSNF